MFYLMTHRTHFIYGYMTSGMINDQSDSERGNPLSPHGLLFPINSVFYMHHPTCRWAHTTAFVTSVVQHLLEREIDQWVNPMKGWLMYIIKGYLLLLLLLLLLLNLFLCQSVCLFVLFVCSFMCLFVRSFLCLFDA